MKWILLLCPLLLHALHINRKCHQVLLIRIIVLLPPVAAGWTVLDGGHGGIQFAFLWPSIYPGQKRLKPARTKRLSFATTVVEGNNNEIGIPGKVFQLVLALIRVLCIGPNYILVPLPFFSLLRIIAHGKFTLRARQLIFIMQRQETSNLIGNQLELRMDRKLSNWGW